MSEISRKVTNRVALGTAAIAAGVIGGSALKHEGDQSQDPDRPVDGAKAKVAYVEPNSQANPTFKTEDGKTYRWLTPAKDRTIQIQQDGEGGLEAKTADGSPISMDLHLPAEGAQKQGSPQQDADPNDSVTFTPETSETFVNSGMTSDGELMRFRDTGGRPLTISEDGEGGLRATNQAGNPVSINLELPTAGADKGGPAKNGNLTPAPPAGLEGPNPPEHGKLVQIK